MHNWDYPKTEYEKQKNKDPKWYLERLINYGLKDEKIDKKLLEEHLGGLKIPENRRDFLKLILYGTRTAH